MQDEIYDKKRTHNMGLKEKIISNIIEVMRFFDVFGAKPMLNA